MRTSKELLFVLSFLLSTFLTIAQSITWQLHHGQGEGIFTSGPDDPPIEEILNELTNNGLPVHGDPGGFAYAEIPPVDDPDWEMAPIDEDGDLCWRLDRSRLNGFMSALDFTYFQTVINIVDNSIPFLIRYLELDDGARAYVFNSAHPEGAFIDGGDGRLFATPSEADLSPLLVVGINRIVIVQFDDSQTHNYIKVSVIIDELVNGCTNDVIPPRMFGILADGSEVPLSELIQERYDCGEEPFIDVKVSDNCDPNPSFNQRIETTPNEDGTSTVFLQYGVKDKSGNENRETYTYIDGGEDTEAPRMFGVLPDGSEAPLADLIQERFDCKVQPFESVKVIDNCDPEPDLQTVTTFSPNSDGSQNITIDYTVTDINGNSNREIYSYVDGGRDLELPSISRVIVRPFQGGFIRDTIPVTENFRTDTFPCTTTSVALPYDELIVEDNCDPEPDLNINTDTTFAADGSLISTLTITAADINGNINQKSYTYVIDTDTEGPELNCSFSSVRFEFDENTSAFIPTKDNLNLFAIDGCGGDVSYQFEPAIVTDIGSTIVKVIATDEKGNASECNVEVFIEGLPCDLTITSVGGRAASCLGDATGSLIVLASSANGAVEYSIDGISFQSNNIFEGLLPETYEITIREVQNPACSISDFFTIIADADDEAPQIVAVLLDGSERLLSESIQENYSCGELPFTSLKAIDNCDSNPFININRESTLLDDGVLRFDLIVTTNDANNNEKQENYIYHVIPDRAPQIFAVLVDGSERLLSEVIQENYDCNEPTFVALKAIDDCDSNPNLEIIADSMLLSNGALFVDLSINVSDSNGNQNQEAYTYSVTDTEAPKIFAVQVSTIEENGEEITIRDTISFADIIVDSSFVYLCNSSPLDPYNRIIAIDNCDASTTPLRTANIRQVLDSTGTTISITTVTYRASDASGNTSIDSIRYSSALSQDVPVFTSCPSAPIIINLGEDDDVFIPIVGENIPVSAEDSCDGEELTYTYEPSEITQAGVSEITIIAIDSDGNESEPCVVIVNVISNLNDSPIDYSLARVAQDELQVKIHPNPFYNQTNLELDLPQASDVRILVRDINGVIRSMELYNGIEAGRHSFDLSFKQLDQGVYFLSVQTATARQSIKVVVL